jgi:Protein of unknown function (DUF1573)
MKKQTKIFGCGLLVFFSLLTTKLSAQEIRFDSLSLDYGQIVKGADGWRVFEFKNVGEAPLIVDWAKGSCGCVQAEYPQTPVPPNGSGQIRVLYDTQKVGKFRKYLYVQSNTLSNKDVELRISGEVLKPKPKP